MIKDYSNLTSRIYMQLSPELSQEFHSMLTDMAQEISRLYEIENAKPSIALELIDSIREYSHSLTMVNYLSMNSDLDNIKQALLKAQEQEKVLKIIKERHIDILNLEECIEREKMGNVASALKYYNENYAFNRYCELTQEEYELLKRWLNEMS